MLLVNVVAAAADQNSRAVEHPQNIYCYRGRSGTFVPTEIIDKKKS